VMVTLVAIGANDCGMGRTTFCNGVGVTDTGGGNVATSMYETLGADEVVFGVVVEGTMDVMGATDITDTAVMAGIEPNYETNGGK
ncbi:hypothetical protein KI387_036831, partial [Taxus chinensis]